MTQNVYILLRYFPYLYYLKKVILLLFFFIFCLYIHFQQAAFTFIDIYITDFIFCNVLLMFLSSSSLDVILQKYFSFVQINTTFYVLFFSILNFPQIVNINQNNTDIYWWYTYNAMPDVMSLINVTQQTDLKTLKFSIFFSIRI